MRTHFDAICAAQLGVITHAQALQAGLTKHEIHSKLNGKKRRWRRLHRGVLLTSLSEPRFEQHCVAALLRVGADSFLCGPSAARIHELDGFTPPPDRREADPGLPIVLCAPRTARPAKGVRSIRVSEVQAIDRAIEHGLRCTSLVRTLIDVVEEASWRNLVMAFEDLHRRGDHAALADRLASLYRYRPWLERLRGLMNRRGPHATPTESAAEAICDDILWRGGMQTHRQFEVRCRHRLRRIDLAFPGVRLGIECDSRAFHTAALDFDRDRVRWAELSAQGWSLLHFTWQQLKDEGLVLRTVRQALRARGWKAA